ncbi:nucleoside phosphorylase [Bradyrhizobium sp. GM2.2]|uniref:phosphorylase family protein n=1 Tax=Bradyrhizobium sp. GM2.2 TaxID=3156358 RepID=UPI00339A063D
MKILIADDSQQKVQRIQAVLLGQCGIDGGNVQVATTAMEARRLLREVQFDLFIMDILLPRKQGDLPSRDSSIELLQELAEEDFYRKPDHIIGLTAFSEEAIAAEPYFQDHLWSVLQFDCTSDEWTKPLANCIHYISRQNSSHTPPSPLVDVCIVTALQEPEMNAVQRIRWKWQAWEPMDDTTFIRRASLDLNNKEYSIVAATAPRMGMIATALLSAKLIARYRPRLIVMAGICAGVKEKANLGDIIFADTSWDWQSGKRVKDKENSQFAMDPHHLPAHEFLRSRAKQLQFDRECLAEIRSNWPTPPAHELRLHVGPVASGSAVLADGQTLTHIREQQRTLLGVEMEGYGLFAAAAAADYPAPLSMVLKAVCDFADPDKNDQMQAYAAYTSAMALQRFLEHYLPDIVARH